MEAVRDLGRDEVWQESFERSLARRGRSSRASEGPRRSSRASEGPPERRPRARRAHKAPARLPAERPRRSTPRTRTAGRRRLGVAASVAVALVVFLAVLPNAFAGRDPAGAVARDLIVAPGPTNADAVGLSAAARRDLTRTLGAVTGTCRPTVSPTGYVNPLLGARVTPERIDQGVDYAGSGTLGAIGDARVTHVATSGTGWPGSFIEYRLLGGADAGCYVYYAEGVSPAPGVRVGKTLAAGQPVARLIPGWESGIEIGWGAGKSTQTYAREMHQWSYASDEDSTPSAGGKSFSALIAALGGPPGKIEG